MPVPVKEDPSIGMDIYGRIGMDIYGILSHLLVYKDHLGVQLSPEETLEIIESSISAMISPGTQGLPTP
jgi:hypothetical protein